MNIPIPKNYILRNVICSGSHSSIASASKNGSNECFAIKSQPYPQKGQKHQGHHRSHRHSHHHSSDDDNQISSSEAITNTLFSKKKSTLRREAKLYKMVAGAPGFPMYKHFISNREGEHLILELLGPNLSTLIKENIQSDSNHIARLSLKTILQIADQVLLRLQYFHLKGYVHGDIKPENIAIGKFPNSNQFHLIDLSLAKRYINKQNGEHLPFSDKHNIQGSLVFSSINAQRGLKISRRDDLESLGYLLVYLLTGSLPWLYYSSLKDVLYSKMNTPVKYLCEGLPPEFENFINSTRCLSYTDQPDYSYYRQLFRDLFIKKGYIYDYVYDWSTIDKRKTTIPIVASFSQTIPQNSVNLITLQSKKNRKAYPKSVTPYHEMLMQSSTHQRAADAMINTYNHCNSDHFPHDFDDDNLSQPSQPSQCNDDNSKLLHTKNASDSQKQSRLLLSSNNSRKSQKHTAPSSSRLLLNYRGNPKNISKQ
ncbi:hypothetical protein M9Y10_005392 [Tritrichomonas musculus]|uniref:Protein kinase domain-containing protein n=1 Tax=Tritrichomonas musculus TaxID=1915356 RepID=A0ABR2JLP4_9EUKA